MKKVIAEIVDDGDFFEVFPLWAMNIVCGFARVDGHVVGIVGNQPQVLAGEPRHRRVREGRQVRAHVRPFNIPLVTFVDVPGFLPGTDQEYGGIIRHGAKLLYAYCEATVPRVQIITRKGYGGAYVVMNSKSIGADIAYTWPSAEIAVMDSGGAVNIIFRREIETAVDPRRGACRLVLEYETVSPTRTRPRNAGYVDDVIDPRDTRKMLARDLPCACCAPSACSCRPASTATRRSDPHDGHASAVGAASPRSPPRSRSSQAEPTAARAGSELPSAMSMWVEASRRSAPTRRPATGPVAPARAGSGVALRT